MDCERPPPKGGGFGLRLKAGLGRPQGPTRELRDRGNWVATSGNVTDEVWKKYIEDQKPRDTRRQLQSRLVVAIDRSSVDGHLVRLHDFP